MKNLLFVLLGLFSVLAFTACGDDDDTGVDAKAEFTYDGTTYDLANGFISDFGSNGNGSFDFDVYLTSSGISAGGFFGLSGTGDYIYLDLNTNSADGLVEGTYNWSSNREENTLVSNTGVFLDYNVTTFSGTSDPATDGTVDISINGNETTLIFNLTTADGKTASGEFTGVLEAI